MKHFSFLLFLFLSSFLAAQACDYDKLFREGKSFAKQRQYKKALYKYNSARRCDPAKGETVDVAIEALLDQVEGEKKAADKALEDLRQTSGKVVESLLRDAENEVYHLRYAEAFEKMNAAAEIGQKKPEVARALIEIAYFCAESGRFSIAKDITILAAKLLGKGNPLIHIDTTDSIATHRAFRRILQSLDPGRYTQLEARYYPVMLDIKGGEFIMGCDKRQNCDSLPYVKLSDFQLARTETTFWQFALYAATTGQKIQDFSPDWGLDGDNPVVNVSWYQSVKYANWLSGQHDLQLAFITDSSKIIQNASRYSLPTEAEWEYAARGGNRHDTFLFCGSDDLAAVAWCSENCDTFGIKRARPVSTRLPNGLGLRDMSGNVWEWCWDWYGDYQPGVFENPTGPSDGSYHVLRGGSWDFDEYICGLGNRIRNYPEYRDNVRGFRLARH